MTEGKETFSQRSHLEALSDVELIAAIKGGDRGALAELYGRHSAPLYSLALKILGHPKLAGIALEEAFLDLGKQAGTFQITFDENRFSVFTCLVLLTRRRALERRPAQPTGERAELPAISSVGACAESPNHKSRHRAVSEAMAVLTASDREILEATFFEGLTLSEIASRARLPDHVIRARAVQAVKDFREALPGELLGRQ